MKSTGMIGMVAGCVFIFAASLGAQDEQPMRHGGFRAQTTPATAPAGVPGTAVPRPQFPQMTAGPPQRSRATPLPVPTPRFRRKRASEMERVSRPDGAGQNHSTSQPSGISNLRALPSPRSSPLRRRSKRIHAQNPDLSHPQSGGSPAASPAERHNGETERHETERTITVPVRTPGAITAPTRAPELAPIGAPVPPPVAATAGPRAMESQSQQAPSRLQRPPLNDLSEDERARLHSAHQSALQRDPTLAAFRTRYLNARKEFREKLRDALLKADPSVQPILEKIRREKEDDR